MQFLDVKTDFAFKKVFGGEHSTEDELETITEKWLYFIPKTFTEPPLLEAFEMANTARLNEDELEEQFKRRDFIYLQKGALAKAQKEGKKEGKLEVAPNMLNAHVPVETILKYTGLPREEVETLQKS